MKKVYSPKTKQYAIIFKPPMHGEPRIERQLTLARRPLPSGVQWGSSSSSGTASSRRPTKRATAQ